MGVIPSTPGHKVFSLTSCDRVVSGRLRRDGRFYVTGAPATPTSQGAAVSRVVCVSLCLVVYFI